MIAMSPLSPRMRELEQYTPLSPVFSLRQRPRARGDKGDIARWRRGWRDDHRLLYASQLKSITGVLAPFRSGAKAPLLVLSAGSWKAVVFSSIAASAPGIASGRWSSPSGGSPSSRR
jgi:hypothetical protein